MNLNHLHLHVASVDRAAAFYERYFGLRRLVMHGDCLFMRDDAGMDFALAPGGGGSDLPDWFHLGFRLSGHDAVRALFDRVTADGVEIRAPHQRHGDFSFFRCADPDGYMIEIYYEPDPPAAA